MINATGRMRKAPSTPGKMAAKSTMLAGVRMNRHNLVGHWIQGKGKGKDEGVDRQCRDNMQPESGAAHQNLAGDNKLLLVSMGAHGCLSCGDGSRRQNSMSENTTTNNTHTTTTPRITPTCVHASEHTGSLYMFAEGAKTQTRACRR